MEKPVKTINRIVRQARQLDDMARSARNIDFASHAVYAVNIDDMHIAQGKLDGMVETFRELCWELGADVKAIEEWLEPTTDGATFRSATIREINRVRNTRPQRRAAGNTAGT